MPKSMAPIVIMILCFPLVLCAIGPVIARTYKIIGRKFCFTILRADKVRMSLGDMDEKSVYRTTLTLSGHDGIIVTYSYYSIERELSSSVLVAGKDVTLFSSNLIVNLFGWSPFTAYSKEKYLRNSVVVYIPLWFIGVMPFVSSGYYLEFGNNMIFDIVNLFISMFSKWL
jgi:hypothetical protein